MERDGSRRSMTDRGGLRWPVMRCGCSRWLLMALQAQGMVQFTEQPERFDSISTASEMESKIAAAIALTQAFVRTSFAPHLTRVSTPHPNPPPTLCWQKLHEMNAQLVVDQNYVSRMARERQSRWGALFKLMSRRLTRVACMLSATSGRLAKSRKNDFECSLSPSLSTM